MSVYSAAKRTAALTAAMVLALTLFTQNRNALGIASADTNKAAKENESAINETEKELSDLEEKQAELDELISAASDDIADQEEKQQAISDQIDTVEETLHKLADSISELEDQIADNEELIAQMETDTQQKEQEIESGVDDLQKRLRAFYIAGGDTYTDILIGASDFYDMLMKLELVKRVAGHDADLIDKLIEKKTEYESQLETLKTEKTELEEQYAELEERRVKQQAQIVKLEELYSQSEENLKSLEEDKASYEKNREQIEKEQEQFEADLQKLYEEREALKKKQEEEKKKAEEERKKQEAAQQQNNQTQKPSDADNNTSNGGDNDSPDTNTDNNNNNTDPNGNSNTNTNTSGVDPNAAYGYVPKSRFTWPVPGFYHISYGVGWRWGAYHKGIDIYSPNIRGANIVAADSGTVILASNTCPHDYGKNYSCGCGGGYGNYCIIDHGDGYWTLYGHSEHISVVEGQHVEKGDVLGTVGSTGYSTGPHTHFEVRINGTAYDPQNYV